MRGEALLGRLSVALAVLCATSVTVTAVAMAMPSVRNTLGIGPGAPKASYTAGQSIDLPSQAYSQAPHTLAIFFRSDCGACERMKLFLQRLAARDSTRVRVLGIAGQTTRENSAFIRQLGLEEDHLITLDLTRLRVSRVPTFVLLDQSGRVEAAFEGIPSAQDQEDLLRRVTSLSQVH